jgi:hypothetical protein
VFTEVFICYIFACFHRKIFKNPIFAQWVISLNLVLAGLRLGLKNRQVGEKWVSDDCSYGSEFRLNSSIIATAAIAGLSAEMDLQFLVITAPMVMS